MGRPKGSLNRKTSPPDPVSAVEAPSFSYKRFDDADCSMPYDLVIGIRRIRTTQFKGLWEVTRLSVNSSAPIIEVLTDANTKPLAISVIAKALSRCL